MLTSSQADEFGRLAPGRFDRTIIAMTSRLPGNWLGLRLAILLRRAVMSRLAYPQGALDVVRWDLRLRLHPRDNGCEKNLLFTPQMYEPTELQQLGDEIAQTLREGRNFVFIDIGANVGLFSLFAAAAAGPRARILAIEPEPGNLERLIANLSFNPGLAIRPIALALSDRCGEVSIVPDRRDRGGTRIGRAGDPGATNVPALTLAAIVTRENIAAIDALKIDVEGNEDKVLAPFFRGTNPTLWPRLVIIEDSQVEWSADLFAIMAECGYAVVARTKLNVILRRS